MNIFSNEEYLKCIGSSLYPGKKISIGNLKCRNQVIKTILINDKKPVLSWPFMDFFESMNHSDEVSVHAKYLPRMCISDVDTAEWTRLKNDPNNQASPYIKWSEFSSWDQFSERCRKINSRAFSKRTPSKIKKIVSNFGDFQVVHKVHDDLAPQLLEILLEWKSRQYIRSGYQNIFANQTYTDMFRSLLKDKILVISAIYAGKDVLAIHAGFHHQKRFYYLLPAYDPEFTKFSAGILLTEAMIEESYRRGDIEFDFLLGDEEYKSYYSNRVRVIAPVGRRLWADGVWLPARSKAMTIVRKFEFMYKLLQSVKRWSLEKGLLR